MNLIKETLKRIKKIKLELDREEKLLEELSLSENKTQQINNLTFSIAIDIFHKSKQVTELDYKQVLYDLIHSTELNRNGEFNRLTISYDYINVGNVGLSYQAFTDGNIGTVRIDESNILELINSWVTKNPASFQNAYSK
jgi:hypothetical protein